MTKDTRGDNGGRNTAGTQVGENNVTECKCDSIIASPMNQPMKPSSSTMVGMSEVAGERAEAKLSNGSDK